jgi:hypothetical protein
MEKDNITKRNDVKVKEQYQDKTSNGFVALENMADNDEFLSNYQPAQMVERWGKPR